jgi:hypothetical protein
VTLLGDLDGFYLEHRRCGELEGDVTEEPYSVVWLAWQAVQRAAWEAVKGGQGSGAAA